MPMPVTVLVPEDLSSHAGRKEECQKKQHTAEDENILSFSLIARVQPLVQISSYLFLSRLPDAKAAQ